VNERMRCRRLLPCGPFPCDRRFFCAWFTFTLKSLLITTRYLYLVGYSEFFGLAECAGKGNLDIQCVLLHDSDFFNTIHVGFLNT
jgi:hypothetical protein